MEKKSWMAGESLRSVVLVLPFIFLLIFWDQLPHGTLGTPQRQASPFSPISRFALTGLALLNLVLYLVFQLWFWYRPKIQADYPTSWRILQLLAHQVLTFAFFLAAFRSLGIKLAPDLVLQYGAISLLLVLGSFLGTIPRNSLFGFRMSWTLKNDAIWQKTHRFAAQVWVYASFFMLLYTGWQAYDWVFPLYVVLLVLLPILYSYWAYRRHLKTLAPPKK
jgi:uncharacterized membrane protein